MENKNTDNIIPLSQAAMRLEFEKYAEVRYAIVNELKIQLEQLLLALDSNPVVSGRHKNFESYYGKYIRQLKNGNTNPQITDLMGIRIICPFIEDLSAAEDLIKLKYEILEIERKGHYSFKEFGYESTHFLIEIPSSIIEKYGNPGVSIAEIQIRTILQDAWAEVEHELVYKAEFNPFDEPMKRKLAAVNANLSLADIIFQEIRSYQRKYSREIERRRESFYNKIEESTDKLLFTEEQNTGVKNKSYTENKNVPYNNLSIDDLIVNALTFHNENRFNEAVNEYTKILELKPDLEISAVIYKHRGMANFACSKYEEAINDFTSSMAYNTKMAYKSAYYRGVVRSVLKQYSLAIDDYTLSLSMNPYQSFCLFRRGQAYYHIGDLPQALSDCENSLSLEPGNEAAVKFKEMLLFKLKM